MNIKNILLKIKEMVIRFFNFIIAKIKKTNNGESNYYIMLYVWGVFPAVILMMFLQKHLSRMDNGFFKLIISLFITLYFLWHLFVIRKTLILHPEHKPVKITKKELYKDKTEEEIKEIKKEKRKEIVQKMLLLRAWNTSPDYIIIACLDAYNAATELQIIFNIIG